MKILRGTVRSGRREAAGLVTLPWVVEQLQAKVRLTPYPGTLNLVLARGPSTTLWKELRQGTSGSTLVPQKDTFCSATCFPVLINGEVPGAIVWPHVEGYPDDVLEVLAAVNLRERFHLRDGDSCTLVLLEGQGASRFECVLFDLEGTLVDFQWRLEDAEEELRRALSSIGFEPAAFTDENYAGIRHRALELAESRGVRAEIDRRLGPIYDRYDLDAESRWTLRQGCNALLQDLVANGRKLAVVTNIGRMATDKALHRLAIADRFAAVVTRNDVARMKPSGEGIWKALDAVEQTANTALMVGDSLSDLLAARDAGVKVALIRGGESAIRSLGTHKPDYDLTSLQDVRKLVLPDC